jgi:plastocyanin
MSGFTRSVLVLCVVAAAACGDDDGGADTGTADTGTADTGGGDTGTADTGAGDGGADDGGMVVNGCTAAEAMDMTGMGAVTITDVSAWSVPHSACIRVSTGTTVTWEGNFDVHPLIGGASGMGDASSPITMAGPGSGMGTVDVTFDAAGDYPYFCGVHAGAMLGVVYVVP